MLKLAEEQARQRLLNVRRRMRSSRRSLRRRRSVGAFLGERNPRRSRVSRKSSTDSRSAISRSLPGEASDEYVRVATGREDAPNRAHLLTRFFWP
jgi:hypothetical protein